MRKAGARLTWAGDASALGLTSQVPVLLGSVFRERLTQYLVLRRRMAMAQLSHAKCKTQRKKTADRADQAAAAVIYVHL